MKELEDYSWFPDVLRRQQTEYIGWMVRLFGVYRSVPALMQEHIPPKALHFITDMGSGSGGPLPQLSKHPFLKGRRFLLTDLYPHPELALPDNCNYLSEPVDARTFEARPHSTISFFNTFHHFSLEEQKNIISRNVARGQCLLVAEILTPDLWCSLRILLATTLGQLLLAPFVKPFRLSRVLFTWLFPMNLLTVTWDGMISVWKSPGKRRRGLLQSHAASLGANARWIQAGNRLLPVQVFICTPAADE